MPAASQRVGARERGDHRLSRRSRLQRQRDLGVAVVLRGLRRQPGVARPPLPAAGVGEVRRARPTGALSRLWDETMGGGSAGCGLTDGFQKRESTQLVPALPVAALSHIV